MAEPPPATLADFQNMLEAAVNSGNVDSFWDAIVATGQMPLTFDSTAVFMYRGEADTVGWGGGFSGWCWSDNHFCIEDGTRIGDTDLWMLIRELPADARFDYQIALNGNEWILDPLNPYQQLGGPGYASVVRMPKNVFPETVIPRNDIAHGTLSDDITIFSENLGYDINYRVYTPEGYDGLGVLPVIYVTDGQDYYHDEMGSMVIVLDNLIADRAIEPIIAVFIDTRNPNTGENRRGTELGTNDDFRAFLTTELVLKIDATYDTNPSPDAGAILGTSWGGTMSAYVAFNHSDKFHLVGIQSPYFVPRSWILDAFEEADLLPLTVFMCQGPCDLDMENTHRLRDILEAKGYPLMYIETNDQHSWGNWHALLDDMLIYFFSPDDTLQ